MPRQKATPSKHANNALAQNKQTLVITETLQLPAKDFKREREDDEEYRYSINSRLGKSGIEKTFENELRGKVGYRTVEVDVHGKEVRELEKVLPSKAKNIFLLKTQRK